MPPSPTINIRKQLFNLEKVLVNILAILFIPRSIVHELSHIIACKVVGVQVIDTRYYVYPETLLNNPYERDPPRVMMQRLESFRKQVIISISPLFLNSIVAVALFIMAAQTPTVYAVPLYGLGWVIGLGALPSKNDVQNMINMAEDPKWSKRLLALLNHFETLRYSFSSAVLYLFVGVFFLAFFAIFLIIIDVFYELYLYFTGKY